MTYTYQTRVYYEDTDLGGIVYHTNYIKYCERARSEIFFQNGLSPVTEDTHFIVKSLRADFIKAAQFGDELEVRTKALAIKKASLTLSQEIWSGPIQIFQMEVDLVCLRGKKISRIPDSFMRLFE